jgi:hypothetical protein
VSANYALRGAVLGLLDSAGVQQPSMLVVPLSDIHTRRVNVEQHHQWCHDDLSRARRPGRGGLGFGRHCPRRVRWPVELKDFLDAKSTTVASPWSAMTYSVTEAQPEAPPLDAGVRLGYERWR